MVTVFEDYKNGITSSLSEGDYFYYSYTGHLQPNSKKIYKAYIFRVLRIIRKRATFPPTNRINIDLEPILYQYYKSNDWNYCSENEEIVNSGMYPSFLTDTDHINAYGKLLSDLSIGEREEIEQLITAKKYNL